MLSTSDTSHSRCKGQQETPLSSAMADSSILLDRTSRNCGMALAFFTIAMAAWNTQKKLSQVSSIQIQVSRLPLPCVPSDFSMQNSKRPTKSTSASASFTNSRKTRTQVCNASNTFYTILLGHSPRLTFGFKLVTYMNRSKMYVDEIQFIVLVLAKLLLV